MLNEFNPYEILVLFKYPIFPILLSLLVLAFNFHVFIDYRRSRNSFSRNLSYITVVLFVKQLILFFLNRRITFDVRLKYYPFESIHFLTIETISTIILIALILKMIDRGHRIKMHLLISMPASIVLFSIFYIFTIPAEGYIIWLTQVIPLAAIVFLVRTTNTISQYTDPEQRLSVPYLPFLSAFVTALGVSHFLMIFLPNHTGLKFLIYYIQTAAFLILQLYINRITNIRHQELSLNLDFLTEERRLTLELFEQIGINITQAENESDVLKLINKAAYKTTNAKGAAIWLFSERKNKFTANTLEGIFPPLNAARKTSQFRHDWINNKTMTDSFDYGQYYLGHVAKHQEPLYITQVKEKHSKLVPQTAVGVMDIRSVIAAPIVIGDKTMGVLAVLNKEDITQSFSGYDLELVLSLAKQCELTINHFELFRKSVQQQLSERDVSIAADIQMGLLPEKFISNDEIDIYGFSHAAKGVGGDYYDFSSFQDGKYGVIMSDVAGKGIPASLVMVMISSVYKSFASGERSPAEVVSRINNTLVSNVTQERYATVFYFNLDYNKKVVQFTNGAHGPMLLYKKKKDDFEILDTDGMPMGIVKDSPYEEKKISVESGDILVLYTDGITEAMNNSRDQYQLERLQADVAELKDEPAKVISDTIYERIQVFIEGAPQHDDESLLIVKIY